MIENKSHHAFTTPIIITRIMMPTGCIKLVAQAFKRFSFGIQHAFEHGQKWPHAATPHGGPTQKNHLSGFHRVSRVKNYVYVNGKMDENGDKPWDFGVLYFQTNQNRSKHLQVQHSNQSQRRKPQAQQCVKAWSNLVGG